MTHIFLKPQNDLAHMKNLKLKFYLFSSLIFFLEKLKDDSLHNLNELCGCFHDKTAAWNWNKIALFSFNIFNYSLYSNRKVHLKTYTIH